jgi:hypothetical protein
VDKEEKEALWRYLLAKNITAERSLLAASVQKVRSEASTIGQLIKNLFLESPERKCFGLRKGSLAGSEISLLEEGETPFENEFALFCGGYWRIGSGPLSKVAETGRILPDAEIEAFIIGAGYSNLEWQLVLKERAEMVAGFSDLPWSPTRAAGTLQQVTRAFVQLFQNHPTIICDILEYERLGRRDAVQVSQILEEIPLSKLTVIESSKGGDLDSIYGPGDMISPASLRVYYETEESLIRRSILNGEVEQADLGSYSISYSSSQRAQEFSSRFFQGDTLRTYEIYPIVAVHGEKKPAHSSLPCYCWGVARLLSKHPPDQIRDELSKAREQVRDLVDHLSRTMGEILNPIDLGYKIVHPLENLGNWNDAFKKIPPLLKDVPMKGVVASIRETLQPRWSEIHWSRMYGLIDEIPWWPLFVGSPGTGKTFLCISLANTLCAANITNRPHSKPVSGEDATTEEMKNNNLFHVLTAAELVSKYPGDTARNLQAWFRARFGEEQITTARLAPSFIFADELDQIARPRSSSGDVTPSEAVPTLLTILSELNIRAKSTVIFAATAQNRNQIEPALQRPGRLDPVIEVNRLALPEIWDALQFYLGYIAPSVIDPKPADFVKDLQVAALLAENVNLSLADVRKITVATQRSALKLGQKVTPEIAKITVSKLISDRHILV